MKVSPASGQLAIAQRLAESQAGAKQLLQLVIAGNASARLLQQASVEQRLEALGEASLVKQAARLTASLPPGQANLTQRITELAAAYRQREETSPGGAAVFKKHCAACHKVGKEGAEVGPQLDGIAGRGLERVLEDVLDPHRNVDIAFRTSTLLMADGRVISGLVRGQEGEVLVVVDGQGREQKIAAHEIEARRESSLSLMPDNLADSIPRNDFLALLAFLMQRQQP